MITKKVQEKLLEIQSEIQAEIEFLEELFDEINKVTNNPKSFKKADLSEYLQNLLGSKAEDNFIAFTKELAKLSKRYGVVIIVVRGVLIGKIKEIEYSDDASFCDIYPKILEWAD